MRVMVAKLFYLFIIIGVSVSEEFIEYRFTIFDSVIILKMFIYLNSKERLKVDFNFNHL